jgi:ParB-like chromosome segregation protein Spo0J
MLTWPIRETRMLETNLYPIANIYVPAKRARTLDPAKVESLAQSILEVGQTTPIRLRQGKGRYVLIEGLHRLEALRALGEERIAAYLVHARLH